MASLKLRIVVSVIEKNFRSFDKAGAKLGRLTAKTGLATGALLGLGTAFAGLRLASDAIQTFASFEEAIVRAAAVMPNGIQAMQRLEDTARELGRTTVFTATEVATGLFFLGQAGLSVEDSLTAIPDVLALAQIGMIDLGLASDIATDTMASFGLKAKDLQRVVDVMTLTFTSSNTSISQMGTAFSKIGPIAAELGITIEEAAAAVGVLSSRGLKGEEAGAALRNIFLRLLNPTFESAKLLDTLGLSIEDVTSGMLDFEDILRALQAGMEAGMITTADIATIFQARATPAVLALVSSLDEAESGFVAFNAALENSQGEAGALQAVLETTTDFAIKRFQAAMEDLKIELGRALAPVFEDLLDVIIDNRQAFLDMIDSVRRMTPQFARLVPLVGGFLRNMSELFLELEASGTIEIFVDTMIQLGETLNENQEAIIFLVQALLILTQGVITIIDWVLKGIGAVTTFTKWIIDLGERGHDLNQVWDGMIMRLRSMLGFFGTLTHMLTSSAEAMTQLSSASSNFGGGLLSGLGAVAGIAGVPKFQTGSRRPLTRSGVVFAEAGEQIFNPRLGQLGRMNPQAGIEPSSSGGVVNIHIETTREEVAFDVASVMRQRDLHMRMR